MQAKRPRPGEVWQYEIAGYAHNNLTVKFRIISLKYTGSGQPIVCGKNLQARAPAYAINILDPIYGIRWSKLDR